MNLLKLWAGEMRWEYDLLVSNEQYEQLLELEETSLLKTRYTIDDNEWQELEFDTYDWNLHGLHILESEFDSWDNAKEYVIPSYVVEEVTHDPRFKNAALSQLSLHEILHTDELAKVLDIPFVSPAIGIEHIVARAEAEHNRTGKSAVIFVAGWSASGKTSAVAKKIGEKLTWSVIISLDDYSKWNTFIVNQQALWNTVTYDEPAYVELEQAQKDISQLQAGNVIEKPTFDFLTGEPWKKEMVETRPYIIIEGLFALHDQIMTDNSIAAFVDASTHGRALRRLLRDIERTPMTAHEILDYFFRVVEPMHQKYVQSTVKNANIIIDNDYDAVTESSRAPNREKQTKIKIPLDTNIIRLLERIWAKHISHTVQYDRYYKTHINENDGEIVRIRKEWDHYQFSYKWPLWSNKYKHIYDCTTDETLPELLKQTYKWDILTVSKNRDLYEIDWHLISIDTNIRICDNQLREVLLEIRDADSQLQENIIALLSKNDIDSTILPQMSYVEYAEKHL